MKIAIAAFAYLGSLLVIGAATLFVVLVVAGPHAGLLPQPLEIVAVLAGWVIVLVAPAYVARSVWRRLDHRGGGA
ncbi:MAG TPA: hypothetical protein VJM11_18015 [Nevskiaceae bacterium]|nr:hypothetical protein [Nevskiaceae bacterium]